MMKSCTLMQLFFISVWNFFFVKNQNIHCPLVYRKSSCRLATAHCRLLTAYCFLLANCIVRLKIFPKRVDVIISDKPFPVHQVEETFFVVVADGYLAFADIQAVFTNTVDFGHRHHK